MSIKNVKKCDYCSQEAAYKTVGINGGHYTCEIHKRQLYYFVVFDKIISLYEVPNFICR